MSFVHASDHPDNNPEDPLYYAPRSMRGLADSRSSATPPDHLPPNSPLSRFDMMREEAFAKFAHPLESQFVHERRPRRLLLATLSGAAVIGGTVIVTLILFNVLPKSQRDPTELAVSISTPASATPAQVMPQDSQALLHGFKQFQKVQSSENPGRAVSDLTSDVTAKEEPEGSRALLEKFMRWKQRK